MCVILFIYCSYPPPQTCSQVDPKTYPQTFMPYILKWTSYSRGGGPVGSIDLVDRGPVGSIPLDGGPSPRPPDLHAHS